MTIALAHTRPYVPAGFPEDVVPLGDLKLNPGRVVQQDELAFMPRRKAELDRELAAEPYW